MNKMKKVAFAVLVVCGMSGFANLRTVDLAGADAVPTVAAESQVMRPLQSYGTMGGYRYRRFTAAAG